MSGKKGMKHYPTSVKEQAVRMHLEEGITTREIMERLGIISERRVTLWCEKYRKNGCLGLQSQLKGRPRKYARTPEQQMEYEMKQLKMEVELLRNFLYEVERR